MGLENALSEITLVLFTSLAPSGAVSIALMAGVLLSGALAGERAVAINKFICIPLVVTMIGLVASATHLGSPSNALYVFSGVGRSPLSNEVFSATLFLGLTGVYWLYSFSLKPIAALQKAWLAAMMAAALAFVAFVGMAYSAETVITWNTPFGPAGIALNALIAGPLLAQFSLHVAGWAPADRRFGRVTLMVSAAALAGAMVCYAAQGTALDGLANHVVSATELVPAYGPMVAAFSVLCAGGIALFAAMLFGRVPYRTRLAVPALLSAFAGIFVMRFAFYMMHLTVGVGV